MQVKCIAECSKGSIQQYFRPKLSYLLSLKSLFCLFLSGGFTQVLLYFPTLGLEVATYMARKNVSSIHVLVRGECPLENVFGKRVGSVFKKVI